MFIKEKKFISENIFQLVNSISYIKVYFDIFEFQVNNVESHAFVDSSAFVDSCSLSSSFSSFSISATFAKTNHENQKLSH